jgi:hypothetical protein
MICMLFFKQGYVKVSDIHKIIKKSSGKYLENFLLLKRSEIFMVVRMKTGIFYDVMPCSLPNFISILEEYVNSTLDILI